jgi:pantoate--beta-alanine ligase
MSELTQRGWAPDYLSARLQSTLLPPTQEDLEQNAKLVILTASKLGKTRLIDNLEIE